MHEYDVERLQRSHKIGKREWSFGEHRNGWLDADGISMYVGDGSGGYLAQLHFTGYFPDHINSQLCVGNRHNQRGFNADHLGIDPEEAYVDTLFYATGGEHFARQPKRRHVYFQANHQPYAPHRHHHVGKVALDGG